ncbi:MAG: hypothetical protein ACXVVQ_20835 [Solirubrobacteraceae bacterium]
MSATTNTDSTPQLGRARRLPRALGARLPRVMDAIVARAVAHANHLELRDRHGEPVIEHVARVAAAVPPEARTAAWLHDVLEKSPTTLDELREQGLGDVDGEVLGLLTRGDGESYELHVLRLAYAPGVSGRVARTVKLADLDDHLARPWACGDPPYAWAHRHVANAAAFTDAGLP